MDAKGPSYSQEFVHRLLSQLTVQERALLLQWAEELQTIRNSGVSTKEKLRRVAGTSAKFKTLVPVIKILGKELKKHGWDDRKLPARLSLSAIALTFALGFGFSGAGLAAFGGAIGLPLWIVFGAGAGFVGIVIDELRKERR